VFAWIVGVVCAAVVATLAVLAVPVLPALTGWAMGAFVAEDTAAGEADAAPQERPLGCRDLHDGPLWATLDLAPGSRLAASTDAPATSAGALVEALAPTVRLTCVWTADAGTISTTVADVPPDAAAVAGAALPGMGFTCAEVRDRMRCDRTAEGVVETIEVGGGSWLSTTQNGWHPVGYADRVAEPVFAE
jgi:hypothetical protein